MRPDLWPLERPLPGYGEDERPPTLVRRDAELARYKGVEGRRREVMVWLVPGPPQPQ